CLAWRPCGRCCLLAGFGQEGTRHDPTSPPQSSLGLDLNCSVPAAFVRDRPGRSPGHHPQQFRCALGAIQVSVQYQAIGWNRQKRVYDLVLAGGIATYLAIFAGLGAVLYPAATAETLLIRGFGTLALVLLNVILCIGPLCRLDRRFLPLLYNRR